MALRASVALMSQVGAAGSPLTGDQQAPGSKLKPLGSSTDPRALNFVPKLRSRGSRSRSGDFFNKKSPLREREIGRAHV